MYPVLQHLEETGRARRGYFIERLGGAQFALPGAVDRVRSVPEHSITVLASTDPANPYGAALDWPAIDDGRIGRIAGTYVILADGHLVGYLDKRKLRTFDLDPDSHTMVAAAIARLGERSRKLRIESIDGEPPAQTALGRVLGEVGFAPALRGLSYRS